MGYILGFLLGLTVGLMILGWQRSRFNRRSRQMLQDLRPNFPEISQGDAPTQLSLALIQRQKHQKELEISRKDLEARLAYHLRVLEAAPFGYLQIDDENRLVWCNTEARSLLCIRQPPLPHTRLLLELVRSYELDQLADQTRKANRPCQTDWVFYPVSQDPMQLSRQDAQLLRGYGFPMFDQNVGIFLESRAETEMLKQQRDRWASDVAHELKTPLTSIRLVAETLQSRVEPGLRGWVDRLVNETVRLSTLVQDLLDLAQLDRNLPHDLKRKPVNLVELVRSAWLNLEPLAQKKNLKLNYDGPESLIFEVDEPRLYRVLVNLLDNGIKYSPPWGVIQARLHYQTAEEANQAPWVVIDVIDTGSGFDENDLPFIFERFYKADRSRAQALPAQPRSLETMPTAQSDTEASSNGQPRTSTGLGLAIVRQIVEAHHGTVCARNHPEAGGAWLTVTLPPVN